MAKLTRADSLEVRFWSRVAKKGPEECWLWTGKLNRGGYGQLHAFGKKGVNAHRVAYVLQVGPIPEGLHIDHLCRVRHCMNAAHLEPVTMAENTRRGLLRERTGANHRARTHCPRGHEYTESNTRHRTYPNGWKTRECKECNRLREERKRRAAGIEPRLK